MSTAKRKVDLFHAEEAQALRDELKRMVLDSKYKTESSYTADASNYPDRLMPFVENHLTYLTKHPGVNPDHYLANLRISLKIRNNHTI